MFRLNNIVRLKKDNARLGIPMTAIGTVVDVLDGGKAYTVEFVDENGDTYEDALFTEFTDNDLVSYAEIDN